MTSSTPPRLAVALLRRFSHHDEPLVGDLFEAFDVRQSARWFWWQTLSAIVLRSKQPRDDEHPLGLAGHSAAIGNERAPHVEVRRINLAASPLPDIGGLGLVVLVTLVTVVEPQIWWIFVPAIFGGVLLGVTMVMVRRRDEPQHPDRSAR